MIINVSEFRNNSFKERGRVKDPIQLKLAFGVSFIASSGKLN